MPGLIWIFAIGKWHFVSYPGYRYIKNSSWLSFEEYSLLVDLRGILNFIWVYISLFVFFRLIAAVLISVLVLYFNQSGLVKYLHFRVPSNIHWLITRLSIQTFFTALQRSLKINENLGIQTECTFLLRTESRLLHVYLEICVLQTSLLNSHCHWVICMHFCHRLMF